MRVLCIDVSGVLGALPSPVLLPEYGDRFLHVSGIGGDRYESVLTDFLHADPAGEAREIWTLWRTDANTPTATDTTAMAAVASQLQSHFDQVDNIPVCHILVQPLASGQDGATFFQDHRPVEKLNFWNPMTTHRPHWKTVWLGIQTQTGDTRAEQGALALSLALRFWMTRAAVATQWPAPHYRVLLKFADIDNSHSIKQLIETTKISWSNAYAFLQSTVEIKKSSSCEEQYIDAPPLLQMAFQEPPQRLTELLRWLRPQGDQVGPIQKSDDSRCARTWVQALYEPLHKALKDGFLRAHEAFIRGRQNLFEKKANQTRRLQQTPWQAVAALEVELKTLSQIEHEAVSQAQLDETLLTQQRQAMNRLFLTLLHRPTWKMMAGVLCISCVLLLPALYLRFDPASTTNTFQLPLPLSRLIGVAALIIAVFALAWALFWANNPLRKAQYHVLTQLQKAWSQCAQAHQAYLDKLNRSLKRMVASYNLEIAQREAHSRDRVISQANYHINLLAQYYQHYTGSDIAHINVNPEKVPFAIEEPETHNPVYQWSGAHTGVAVSGFSGANTAISIKTLLDPRLAGLSSLEIQCISPNGRVTPDPETHHEGKASADSHSMPQSGNRSRGTVKSKSKRQTK